MSGRLPNPMNARIIASAPRIPVTKFGFWSSKMRPYRPTVNRTKAMFGSESRWRKAWSGFMGVSVATASVSSRTVGVPLTITSWPSAWARTSSSVSAIPSTAPAATASLAG